MRFLSTRGHGHAVTLKLALFEGLAPDGGLYVPEAIPPWAPEEIAALGSRSLVDLGVRALAPYVAPEIDEARLRPIVADALDFPIPLIEVEPGVHALELFHGPTLAFKDIGARTMARLMSALHEGGEPLTVLVATSGDTGGAVGHAFDGVPHTRVVILYPEGRVSPTQEAQLTMFNGAGRAANVRAYAVAGSFDDCQRLVKEAFADPVLRERVRLTSANSINIGRLLPQTIYYFHAIAELRRREPAGGAPVVSTPSGNFGNLTAGLVARRSGLPVAGFVAATNVNDVVPIYLATGRFEPRASIQTIANAMDVGNPSNFERMLWVYGGPEAMRADIAGSRHDDREVRLTIARVYRERGYLMDPHTAIAYLGLAGRRTGADRPGVLLATAHPAKFAEVVEPIVGHAIEKPASLAEALGRRRQTRTIRPVLDEVRALLVAHGCHEAGRA